MLLVRGKEEDKRNMKREREREREGGREGDGCNSLINPTVFT